MGEHHCPCHCDRRHGPHQRKGRDDRNLPGPRKVHHALGHGNIKRARRVGIDDGVAACALGAKFIEKHFTIDKSLPGRDNKFALDEAQMTQLCDTASNISSMLSTSNNSFMEAELSMRDEYRGRWDG